MGCSPDRFPIRPGDLLPELVAAATYCDPADHGRRKAMDFTGWTSLTFLMVGPRTITGSASGDALGNLQYDWQPGDTNAPGAYRAWFSGVSPEGKKQTFPTEGAIAIVIG
jgi:hypothetical protein